MHKCASQCCHEKIVCPVARWLSIATDSLHVDSFPSPRGPLSFLHEPCCYTGGHHDCKGHSEVIEAADLLASVTAKKSTALNSLPSRGQLLVHSQVKGRLSLLLQLGTLLHGCWFGIPWTFLLKGPEKFPWNFALWGIPGYALHVLKNSAA